MLSLPVSSSLPRSFLPSRWRIELPLRPRGRLRYPSSVGICCVLRDARPLLALLWPLGPASCCWQCLSRKLMYGLLAHLQQSPLADRLPGGAVRWFGLLASHLHCYLHLFCFFLIVAYPFKWQPWVCSKIQGSMEPEARYSAPCAGPSWSGFGPEGSPPCQGHKDRRSEYTAKADRATAVKKHAQKNDIQRKLA